MLTSNTNNVPTEQSRSLEGRSDAHVSLTDALHNELTLIEKKNDSDGDSWMDDTDVIRAARPAKDGTYYLSYGSAETLTVELFPFSIGEFDSNGEPIAQESIKCVQDQKDSKGSTDGCVFDMKEAGNGEIIVNGLNDSPVVFQASIQRTAGGRPAQYSWVS